MAKDDAKPDGTIDLTNAMHNVFMADAVVMKKEQKWKGIPKIAKEKAGIPYAEKAKAKAKKAKEAEVEGPSLSLTTKCNG